MTLWLIIMGSGLDDWIYLRLLLQSLIITINYKNSQRLSADPVFLECQGLAPILVLVLRLTLIYDWTTYIVWRWTHRRHIHCPAMDICEPHRKHHFLYCIYSALHRNGSYPIVACVFVVAYRCRLYLATGCLPRTCLRRNMFTKSLPSNGSACHSMLNDVSSIRTIDRLTLWEIW
jgi:hypothetical protein